MLSLLSEVHFWTLKDNVSISNSDFGAFRYHDKKSHEDTIGFGGKKSYAEKRGLLCAPQNKRPIRMKDNLKELEEHLAQQRIVLCQWRDCSLLQLMFGSGLFVNISVNIFTGDPVSITIDKFLVGKLLSDYVSDVVITKSHLICSYNDNQLTLVYFAKPTLKRSTPKSFSRLDPRTNTIDLAGPTGRRLERKLACNVSGDMVVVWWPSSHDEVYPWSPIVKDQDRANVMVYGISGLKADLLCHHRSEFDLLSVSFSQVHSNIVRSVEQKVSRNGDVTVESSSYQISRGAMQRTSAASISLPTHVCCHSFSPLQDKLLLGCIDGSLVLYDEALGVTHIVRAAFIPCIVSWHPDGGIFVISNERCQFQIFDAALATLKQQLLSEDVTPGNLLDITSYFRTQPTLRSIKWNGKAETNYYGENFSVSDCLLLLLFDRGPLATLRFVGGGGLFGDIHSTGGYTVDSLVAQYLWTNQVDRAISLLLTLNWDIAGSTCLSCLQRIVNHLFKLPLTPDHEVQIQTVLGCFHMPVRPMCPATIDEFKAPIRDLTRRFFHLLLRYKLFEKAFRLAIDLMDRDIFMDIYFSAKQTGHLEIADAALKKAEELETSSYASSTSGSCHSKCSRSSCSECSDSTSMVSDSEDQEPVDATFENNCRSDLGKIEAEKQHQIPFLGGNKTKSLHLPALTNTLIPQHHEISPPVGNQLPSTFGYPKKIGVNETQKNRSPTESLPEKVLPSAQTHQTLTIQNERPKVKFCDTVTQITLPDRLHTLLEEEEDHQLPYQFSSVLSPSVEKAQDLKNDNVLIQKISKPPSSFSQSANSVGIPILPPASLRTGFPDRKSVDIKESYSLGHLVSRTSSQMTSSSMKSTSMQRSEPNSKNASQPQNVHAVHLSTNSLAPAFYHDVKTNQGLPNAGIGLLKELKESLNIERQDDEFCDTLGTEELSALLPGSRKPLTSSTNNFERSLSSDSISNGGQKDSSTENTYFLNYNGTVHDLSEEEENNGSIKIVHFGVV